MAEAASSVRPDRVRSRLLAAATAATPPNVSISFISDAPPIEGAFKMVNQSRCFVTAPFVYTRGFR